MNRNLLAVLPLALFATSSQAAFHLWQIQEVYRSADGSVQFVELIGISLDGQHFLNNQQIRLETNSGAVLDTYTFDRDFEFSQTNGMTLLIGTANLGTLYGVTPDYVYSTANFDIIGGVNRQLNFAPLPDIESLVDLPTNGASSINGLVAIGNPARINAQASPRNYAGSTAMIPEPGTAGFIACGALALTSLIFSRRRKRS